MKRELWRWEREGNEKMEKKDKRKTKICKWGGEGVLKKKEWAWR